MYQTAQKKLSVQFSEDFGSYYMDYVSWANKMNLIWLDSGFRLVAKVADCNNHLAIILFNWLLEIITRAY